MKFFLDSVFLNVSSVMLYGQGDLTVQDILDVMKVFI